MKQPFRFQTKEEGELETANEAVNTSFQVVGDRARKCLGTEDFKAYRDEYRRAEGQLVDALLKYNRFFHKNNSGDATKYAITVSTMLTRLEALRSLLDVVAKESQKGQRS